MAGALAEGGAVVDRASPDPAEGGVIVEHLAKHYRQRYRSVGEGPPPAALLDVNLNVASGRFVSVIGPSGSGKSTLLRIVAGLSDASEGRVTVFGQSPAEAAAGKRIGFVPQSPALLPWRDVLDNVRLPSQVNRRADATRRPPARDAAEVLAAVGLGAVLHERPAALSGGMRQRVAIARAFAFDPDLLVMDEPFSALDELTRETLRVELLGLWESDRKTVLFVTHSVTEAVLLSDAVVVLSAAPGTVAAVVPVDLPRPRGAPSERTASFLAAEQMVREALRGGAPPVVAGGRRGL